MKISGTVRALTSADFDTLRKRVDEVVASAARVHRCEARVEWEAQPYGPTSNDEGAEAALSEVVGRLASVEGRDGGSLGNRKAGRASATISYERAAEPTMAAEDFGFLASRAPRAVFAFLGTGGRSGKGSEAEGGEGGEEKGESTGHGLHTSRFLMDDEQLAVGAAVHAAMALDGLERAAAAEERRRRGNAGGSASSSTATVGRDEL